MPHFMSMAYPSDLTDAEWKDTNPSQWRILDLIFLQELGLQACYREVDVPPSRPCREPNSALCCLHIRVSLGDGVPCAAGFTVSSHKSTDPTPARIAASIYEMYEQREQGERVFEV